MSRPNKKALGALISAHGTSPVFLQRAAIVAILSFLFFLITLIFFYLQQEMMYFILSSAFLVIYIFTMIGWVLQKRNVISVYEKGISKRQFIATWEEIQSVKAETESGITIVKTNGESLEIPKTTADIGKIAVLIRQNLPS
jgi:ABC-type bacteriocin/lantibiotic exporter with double-glycine peptidase domain